MKIVPGMRFGLLVATRFSHRNGSSYYWYFNCDCGNKDVLKSTSYVYHKSGNPLRKSCGCASKNKELDTSIIGKRFGRLTVVSFDKMKNKSSYWMCECDCGKFVSVRRNSLGKGTNSCGCYKEERNKRTKKANILLFFDDYIEAYDESNSRFLIDLEDEDKITGRYWKVKNGYVVSSYDKGLHLLHRILMSPPETMVVDHINRDTLDNRKQNLRICTDHQNVLNKSISKNNKSGYTGVYKDNKRWRAIIFHEGRNIHLGSYEKIEDAINSRLEAERKYFGEYAPKEKY